MSPPPDWNVHVPPLLVCDPAGIAPPMSVQVHGAVHVPGGGGAELIMATLSKLVVASVDGSCESTASPAVRLPGRLSCTVDPGIHVKFLPSLDVYAA